MAGHNSLAVPPLAVVKRGSAVSVGAPGAKAHAAGEILDACRHKARITFKRLVATQRRASNTASTWLLCNGWLPAAWLAQVT